ncbi:hypothetical protein PG997_012561 [Apiospora hydei]|uniref:Uncharacterized protein n=1 Tax=Apiospora hydei TaxID=1337664 RepID=A0ABR1V3Q2_9PEZI
MQLTNVLIGALLAPLALAIPVPRSDEAKFDRSTVYGKPMSNASLQRRQIELPVPQLPDVPGAPEVPFPGLPFPKFPFPPLPFQ